MNFKFHLYADDLQLYTVDLGRDVDTLVRLVNEDLERIRRWSVDNSLVRNVSKTQAMLIFRRDRGVVVEHPLTVAGDVVVFSDSVENLGLYFDNRLSWREQVSRVVSRTYSTLRLLYRFQRYTSRDLRIYLVRSLIIPIFLFTDVVYFPLFTFIKYNSYPKANELFINYLFALFLHIISMSGILLVKRH
jgi:hypothetical protein